MSLCYFVGRDQSSFENHESILQVCGNGKPVIVKTRKKHHIDMIFSIVLSLVPRVNPRGLFVGFPISPIVFFCAVGVSRETCLCILLCCGCQQRDLPVYSSVLWVSAERLACVFFCAVGVSRETCLCILLCCGCQQRDLPVYSTVLWVSAERLACVFYCAVGVSRETCLCILLCLLRTAGAQLRSPNTIVLSVTTIEKVHP